MAALENTLRAFRLARELGADGVEFDVPRLADGSVVVHHDPVLADGRTLSAMVPASVPSSTRSLAEALTECRGLLVNVEIKNDPADPGYEPGPSLARAVAEEVRRAGNEGSTVVSSFSDPTLAALAGVAPDLDRAMLTGIGRATGRRCARGSPGAASKGSTRSVWSIAPCSRRHEFPD